MLYIGGETWEMNINPVYDPLIETESEDQFGFWENYILLYFDFYQSLQSFSSVNLFSSILVTRRNFATFSNVFDKRRKKKRIRIEAKRKDRGQSRKNRRGGEDRRAHYARARASSTV